MSRKGLFNGECVTDGCTTSGATGMSIWDASGSNDRFRCRRCNDTISLLIPNIPDRVWTLGLVDRAAYDAHRRRVIGLNHEGLQAMAGPLRTRERAAHAAMVRLFKASNDVLARDNVAVLVDATDLLTAATITNWWVQHRYQRYDATEPG